MTIMVGAPGQEAMQDGHMPRHNATVASGNLQNHIACPLIVVHAEGSLIPYDGMLYVACCNIKLEKIVKDNSGMLMFASVTVSRNSTLTLNSSILWPRPITARLTHIYMLTHIYIYIRPCQPHIGT